MFQPIYQKKKHRDYGYKTGVNANRGISAVYYGHIVRRRLIRLIVELPGARAYTQRVAGGDLNCVRYLDEPLQISCDRRQPARDKKGNDRSKANYASRR